MFHLLHPGLDFQDQRLPSPMFFVKEELELLRELPVAVSQQLVSGQQDVVRLLKGAGKRLDLWLDVPARSKPVPGDRVEYLMGNLHRNLRTRIGRGVLHRPGCFSNVLDAVLSSSKGA